MTLFTILCVWFVAMSSGWWGPLMVALVFATGDYVLVQFSRGEMGLRTWELQRVPFFLIKHILWSYIAYGLGRIAILAYNRLRRGGKTTDTPSKSV